MKSLTLTGLTLLSATPALAHTLAVPHTHDGTNVWPVLIGCLAIAAAAAVYVKIARPARAR